MAKLTIDDLGKMIKEGFDGQDKKFKKVDDKFKKVDDKFKKVDEQFNEVNKKIGKIIVKQVVMEENIKQSATKEELIQAKNEILDAVDGIAKKQEDVDVELTFNKRAHDRIQGDATRLESMLA